MLNSLLKALNNSNSVSLPNFGGFMKMGSSFMFNEFLKFNDGKFSKFLQENENLNEQDANAKIETFITEIKAALDSTGSFSMNQIGTLKLVDGKIKLEKPATDSAVKEEKPTLQKSESKPIVPPNKEEKIVVKKTKEKEVIKVEKDIPKVKEPIKTVRDLSSDFTVKEAQEKIKSLNDKQDIIDFTKGDKRKTIIEALNQRLKSINKIDTTELDILAATSSKKGKEEKITPIKEGSKKEVKKQVSQESDILNTVVEKENADTIVSKKEVPEIKKVPSSPPIKEEVKKDTKPPQIEKNKKNSSEEEDLVALTNGAIKLEKEAKGRKRNKIIFWIALICILSGGGVVGYLKQDLIMSWFESSDQLAQNKNSQYEKGSSTENDDTNEHEIAETTEEDIQIVEENEIVEEMDEVTEENNQPLDAEEEEEIIEVETVIEPEEEIRVQEAKKGSYYVVVGSFSKEKNAINLVKALKEEGFNDAKVFQNGNLQSVSLGTFANSDEAKEALKQSGKDGWVKKPR